MDKIIATIRNQGVGTKLALTIFLLVGTLYTAFTIAIGYSNTQLMEQQSVAAVKAQTRMIIDMIEVLDSAARGEAGRAAKIFKSSFNAGFTLDTAAMVDIGGIQAPTLKNGDTTLDLSAVDKLFSQGAAVATIFVKSGEDFMAVSSSLKKEDGQRAVGTLLERNHPGYRQLLAGEAYSGPALLSGKQFITQYEPIKDAAGKVIGILQVGIDISAELTALKNRIKSIKIGETGYFFALNAKPGPEYGTQMIHPKIEGQNILEARDSDGRYFVKEMLTKKQGVITYQWQNKGESSAREKITAYDYIKGWDWVVGGGVYTDEITDAAKVLRNRYAVIGTILNLIMAGLLFLVIRQMVTRPLANATRAAQQIAAGDLSIALKVQSGDEIGQLTAAMNGISQGLANVVGNVRLGTEAIASASREIACGNADLSARTESQASSLEETASSIEQLTGTVKQNADNARQANQLAATASTVAVKGGQAVGQVVDTMGSIKESSHKIADIISVIDGIAFQTNILALNAAVEAARAGEQGRGFAVVATEVRNLAQRSAAAAKEIKELIDDSVAKVERGSRQVDDAGQTMDDIVASIGHVTDIMSEISAASQEQSTGIAQVNQAIGQMDQMTQQNAALVEQAASAAESMQDQAASLAQAVSVFKLGAAAHAAGALQPQPAAAIATRSAAPRLPVKASPAAQAKPPAAASRATGTDDWEEF